MVGGLMVGGLVVWWFRECDRFGDYVRQLDKVGW